jgi:hypothetical protein
VFDRRVLHARRESHHGERDLRWSRVPCQDAASDHAHWPARGGPEVPRPGTRGRAAGRSDQGRGELSETIASAAIELDAKDEQSRAFYGKYGFESLTNDRLHMYLPMATARELVRQQSG